MRPSGSFSAVLHRIAGPIALILFCACPISACGLHGGAPQASAARAQGAGIAWTQYQDPFEHAFTLAVPQGWAVKGGLFRLGYSDERPMVELRSPDGQIEIRLGDVSIPTYTLPSQFHFREGEVYDLGAQAQMVVARYRTGPAFAVLYSHVRFGSQCHQPQPDSSAADVAMPDYLPIGSDATQSSSGQIAYRCTTDQGPRIAYTYTRTVLTSSIWQAPTLVSLLSTPQRAAAARAIALHCIHSFMLNPQWLDYQKNMDAQGMQYQRMRQQQRLQQLQAQVQQFQARMRAMQNQVKAFEQHQAAQAAQVESFTNVLNGITPTTDPLTGEQRQVWTGTKDNYWVNGVGQVVNSHDAPSPDYRQINPK